MAAALKSGNTQLEIQAVEANKAAEAIALQAAATLNSTKEEPTLRGAILEDPSYAFTVAPQAAISNNPPFPLVVGVSRQRTGQGRMILLTFPLGYTNPAPLDPRTPGILLKILELFGVTGLD